MKNIITTIVIIALVVASVCTAFAVREVSIKSKVEEYLENSTEDGGDYTVGIYYLDHSNREGRFYLAFMIDGDGDYEAYIVRYNRGEFEKEELWWK